MGKDDISHLFSTFNLRKGINKALRKSDAGFYRKFNCRGGFRENGTSKGKGVFHPKKRFALQ